MKHPATELFDRAARRSAETILRNTVQHHPADVAWAVATRERMLPGCGKAWSIPGIGSGLSDGSHMLTGGTGQGDSEETTR